MLVLAIDDDLHFQRIFKEEFEDRGHEVLLAIDGQEALEIYEREQNRIDVVTIDIILPDIDGIRLLRRFVEINKKIPKIMLSAYDYRDDFAIWASDAYIVKSSDFEEIIITVRKTGCGIWGATSKKQTVKGGIRWRRGKINMFQFLGKCTTFCCRCMMQ